MVPSLHLLAGPSLVVTQKQVLSRHVYDGDITALARKGSTVTTVLRALWGPDW